MTRMGVIYRPVKSSLWLHILMTGVYTIWVTGDLDLKDYVVLQKTQNKQSDRLPPPRTLIIVMDFTLTHTCFGRSNLHPIGPLTDTNSSDGVPEPTRPNNVHVRRSWHFRSYLWCLQSSFRLLFLHTHRETSDLNNEPTYIVNLKVSVGFQDLVKIFVFFPPCSV
jgi:hypothetical protein